ncbi:MAG: TRAP transporter small permease [Rhodobacteraceae bacterium]|nr:TRAP transporter small permease [Paracoccaceae bacterium]
MSMVQRILGRLIDAATLVGGIAVLLMILHITADVVAKYVFNAPLPGTIAIVSTYYMVAVVFIPLAFAERRSGHISVEVLTRLLPGRAQRGLSAVAAAYSALIFGLLAWRGFGEAMNKTAIGTFIIEQDTRIDTWPAFWLLPLGAGLMVAALVFKLLRYLAQGADHDTERTF